MIRTRRTVFALIILAMLITPLLSYAQVAILQENFERPIGTPFPWESYGHFWQVDPPTPMPARWDIERDAIYHQGVPGQTTAAWCVGSDASLLPGVDYYPDNTMSHMYWGPFSTEEAVEAVGNFWYWADVEDNSNGDGDLFMLGIKQGPFSPVVGDWDVLYELDGGGDQTWHQVDFDLSQAMSGDSLVSYLDMDNLYIDFIFQSDGDNNDHYGVFVDDIAMMKYLGDYDFRMLDMSFVDPNNPDIELGSLFAGQDYQVMLRFKVYGSDITPPVTHALYDGNNQVIAAVRNPYPASQVGIIYDVLFDQEFTAPAQPQQLIFTAFLDALLEVDEPDELNNAMMDTINVVPIVNVQLMPHNPNIFVHRGETFFYNAELMVGGMAGMVPGWIWTEAILPNGSTYGPVYQTYVQFWPFMHISVTNIGVTVPYNAPAGNYEWVVAVGATPGNTFTSDSFPFTVTDSMFVAEAADEWTVSGMDAFAAEAQLAGNEAAAGQLNGYALNAAYPNPFNPTTTFSVQLPEASPLTVKVYNVAGQQVAELANGLYPVGLHPFTFNAANVASGLYFVHATVPGQLDQVQKVVLVR